MFASCTPRYEINLILNKIKEEDEDETFKHFLSKNENTIRDLSDIFQERYPEQRGFTVRSIKRFCEEKEIRQRGLLSDKQLCVFAT